MHADDSMLTLIKAALIPWLSGAEVSASGAFEVITAADAGVLSRPEVTVPDPGR